MLSKWGRRRRRTKKNGGERKKRKERWTAPGDDTISEFILQSPHTRSHVHMCVCLFHMYVHMYVKYIHTQVHKHTHTQRVIK